MFFTTAKRIIKTGFVNFWRNGFVSLASVLVMTIALLVIGSVIFSTAVLRNTLFQLKNKADINVYFATSASEKDILALKTAIERLPETASVEYTTKDQAFENFKKRHENDELMAQVFDILGENPLGASLTVKAKNVTQYEAIARFLKQEDTALSSSGVSIIDDINYFRNKVVIDRLSRIVSASQQVGFILAALLLAISVLITFNTIRLAIYTARDEISIMTLVGASYRYVRWPFVVSGILYGTIASFITIGIYYVATFWIEKSTGAFFTGISLFKYYIAHFTQVSVLILISGIALGGLSSYFAVRRYLKL